MKKINKIILLQLYVSLSLTFIFLISSCHKDYIYISNEFGNTSVYNKSKNEVVFYKFIHVAKPPKSFGKSKTIFKKTAVYTYNIETKKLSQIHNFGELPTTKDNWIQGLSFQNDFLAFSIRPVSNWVYHKEYENALSGIFLYDLEKNSIQKIHSKGFNPSLSPDETKILYFTKEAEISLLSEEKISTKESKLVSDSLNHFTTFIWKDDYHVFLREPQELSWKLLDLEKLTIQSEEIDTELINIISLRELENLTSDIPFYDWGIKIDEIVPKSKKARIKDIITAYGNQNYRLAVLEEIKDELSKDEIRKILTEIGMHKENLSSYDRSRYDMSSNLVIEKLNFLLNDME